MGHLIKHSILCIIVAALTSKFPDIDQVLAFLRHRSFLSHSALLPLILLMSLKPQFQWVTIGVSMAIGSHLVFDMYPRGWGSYSQIYILGYGYTGEIFSWIWMFVNMLLCLKIIAKFSKNLAEKTVTTVLLSCVFLFQSLWENRILFPVITWIFVVTIVFFREEVFSGIKQHGTPTSKWLEQKLEKSLSKNPPSDE